MFLTGGADDYLTDAPHVVTLDAAVGEAMAGRSCVWAAEPWVVRRFLHRLYISQRGRTDLPPVSVFIDEAYLSIGRGSFVFPSPDDRQVSEETILAAWATTANRLNMQWVLIAQKPQFLDPGAYRTARYHVFFTLDAADVEYLSRLGYDFDNPEWYDYVVVRA